MKPCDNTPCPIPVGSRATYCVICRNYKRRTGRHRTAFVRRADVSKIRRGPSHPRWKGQDARSTTQRSRMNRLVPIEVCESCGGKAHDRHHVDGNPHNNSLGNVRILCRRCHMSEDGRLAAFIAVAHRLAKFHPDGTPRMLYTKKPCTNCEHLYYPLRKGLCHACNEYKRRNGTNRPFGKAQKTPARDGQL